MATVVKNPLANAGGERDAGLIPGSGRFSGEGNGNPVQYSCLENPWIEEPGHLQSMGSQKSDTGLSEQPAATAKKTLGNELKILLTPPFPACPLCSSDMNGQQQLFNKSQQHERK